jgi:hypothetical protein
VRQHRRRTGVVDEPLLPWAISQSARRKLQGDGASVFRITRTIDISKAAFANALEQVVVRDNANRVERWFLIQTGGPPGKL